jgi:hypothetical protein
MKTKTRYNLQLPKLVQNLVAALNSPSATNDVNVAILDFENVIRELWYDLNTDPDTDTNALYSNLVHSTTGHQRTHGEVRVSND